MSAIVQLVEERSDFAVVSDEVSHAEAARKDAEDAAQTVSPVLEEPRYGRAAVRGGAVGFVVVTFFIGLVGMASGLEMGSLLGLAMYVGFFGGVGFGAMFGASLCTMLGPAPHP